jgi:hypothetical protein
MGQRHIDNNRKETPLCSTHDAQVFGSREYVDRMIKALHIQALDEYIRYGDELQNKILDKVKRRYQKEQQKKEEELKDK